MPVQVVWDNADKTIMRFIYSGSWTWEEYHDAISALQTLIQGVTHTVHMIVDMSGGIWTPPGSFIDHMNQEKRRMPPNMGMTVIVGRSLMLKVIFNVMNSIRGKNMKPTVVVDSLEKAYPIIHRHVAEQPSQA